MAGTRSEASGGQALLIGLLMGLFSVGLVFGIGAILNLFLDIGLTLIIIISSVASFYIAALACLGAIVGGNKAGQQAVETTSSR